MTTKQIESIKAKVNASLDHEYKTKVYLYWIDINGKLCRARLDTIGRTSYKAETVE